MSKRKTHHSSVNTVTGDQIDKMHSLLANDLGSIAGSGLSIVENGGRRSDGRSPKAWKETQIGMVRFRILGDGRGNAYAYPSDDDDGGPVIQLRPTASRRKLPNLDWFVTWTEEWKAMGGRNFQFRTAGWRVYCGKQGEGQLLLLRAEWQASSPRPAETPENSGQPHWHVHRVLELPGLIPIDEDPLELEAIEDALPIDEEVLQNLEPSGEQLRRTFIDLKRFHLGMAGWLHPGIYPSCWQHPFGPDVCNELRIWSRSSLEYVQSQLVYISSVGEPNVL